MDPKVPAIQVSNVDVRLRGQLVLDGVSFSLEQREFLGLIGPNGGGKTVLLRTLLGLVRPERGEVRIFGKPSHEARSLMGYVPQFARFDVDFPVSVKDTVLTGRLGSAGFQLRYTPQDREIVFDILRKVDMYDQRDTQLGKLSGGQMQRVLIARALAGRPKLLLLDEPTASLDTKVGLSFYDLLKTLAKDLTIVLVSHDVGVIAEYVQVVACLNRRLHYHHSKELRSEVIQEVYGCPIELLAHGHAHRVLGPHGGEE